MATNFNTITNNFKSQYIKDVMRGAIVAPSDGNKNINIGDGDKDYNNLPNENTIELIREVYLQEVYLILQEKHQKLL